MLIHLPQVTHDPDHYVNNCRVDTGDLKEAARIFMTLRTDGRIIDAGSPAGVEIQLGAASYRIKYDHKSEHRWGDGGESETLALLVRGDRPVLAGVRRARWGTYSDDSMDYDMGMTHELFLLDDHDALAVGCYAILARRNKADDIMPDSLDL
jgi:hypothetical protein